MTVGKRKLGFTFSILVVYVAAALAAAQTTATPCRTRLQAGAPQDEKGVARSENTYWKLFPP